MHKLTVTTPHKNYPIYMGEKIFQQHADLFHNQRCFVIADQAVNHFHANDIQAVIKPFATCILPQGEGTKTFAELQKTLDWLLGASLHRDDVIVAIGGGVTGDHAGFAASIALRGVRFIQIPTTLLAQVDSSIGGKTGINTSHGKNLIGTFYQPDAVLIDTHFLSTLPERELKAGYAEIAKAALLYDADFFSQLSSQNCLKDPTALTNAIKRACQIKAEIVGLDERETSSKRALLNLGHTFAHTLEWACNYDSRLLHGEAVAIGLCLAARVSDSTGFAHAPVFETTSKHLKAIGLPTRIADIAHWPQTVTAEDLYARMRYDKKMTGSFVKFVLLRDIGQAEQITQPIAEHFIVDSLKESLFMQMKTC